MGMVQEYYRVSEKEIQALAKVKDFKSRNLVFEQAVENIYLDKSWEFLHYLLTKKKYPAEHIASKLMYPNSFALESSFTEEESERISETGTPAERDQYWKEVELDTMYLSPEEVEEISNYLQTVKMDELISKCDFDKVNELEIYPGVWNDDEDSKKYIKDNYDMLFSFLVGAAKEKNYVIVERC